MGMLDTRYEAARLAAFDGNAIWMDAEDGSSQPVLTRPKQITTDGWKKKTAEQGTPLINVCLLNPEGGSIFHKVCCLFLRCSTDCSQPHLSISET
jgi:hypothetical protein